MRDDFRDSGAGDPLWTQRPYQKYGPQGAATVMELQRLQEAFDREFKNPKMRPATRVASQLGARSVAGKKRKKKEKVETKSVMGKMVSACLQGLGFVSADARDFESPRIEPRRSREERPKPEAYLNHDASRRNHAAPGRVETPNMGRSWRETGTNLEEELADMLSSSFRPGEHARALEPLEPIREARRETIQGDLQMLPALTGKDKPSRESSSVEIMNRAVIKGMEQARRGYGFLVSSDHLDLDAGARLQTRVAGSLDRELRTGLRVLLAGFVVFGGWATFVPLASAVSVPGALVAETSLKKIQHSTGGVVAQILARDGMHVNEGDLLLRLDETQTRTNREVIAAQLNQVRVRIARLVAERDGLREPPFPRELSSATGDKEAEQLLASERSLFKARASSRQNQKDVLQSHIVQLEGEISGLTGQVKSKSTQIDLIREELKGLQGLFERHLVPLTRLTTLQREQARLEGEQAQMASAISEAKSKTEESRLQIEQIDQTFRSEVLKDLREAQDKEAELAERLIAAKDQLDRVELRAPSSGVVHQLSAHTVGGVISPAEVIMEIVPDTDELQVEARLPPNEIDHVRTNQKGMVRFSAFNQRTTPQLEGVVSYVSADVDHDRQSNAPYYTVRVTLPGDQRRRLGNLQLVSGMPAEVFLQTGSRTMMSYLLKPLADQLQRSFNEP